MKSANLYTRDQKVRFLMDDALFGDSLNARVKAVTSLSRNYGLNAIPIIEQIAGIIPATYEEFRVFCFKTIDKIRDQAGRGEKLAGLWF